MQGSESADPVSTRQWYPLGMVESMTNSVLETCLLGESVRYRLDERGHTEAFCRDRKLPSRACYGFLWTTLDTDVSCEDLIPRIPEADEPDRNLVCCGSIAVKASGLRVVENFLDMAHFPFVHTDILAQSHTQKSSAMPSRHERKVVKSGRPNAASSSLRLPSLPRAD